MAIEQVLKQEVKQLKSTIKNSVKRSKISLTGNDAGKYQLSQIKYFANKTKNTHLIMPYGLAANPSENEELLTFNIMGQEENTAGIPYAVTKRFKNLAKGEVKAGNPLSNAATLFRNDGVTEINGSEFEGLVKINEITSKLNDLVSDYNSHTHSGVQTGGGISGTPSLPTNSFSKSDYENTNVLHGQDGTATGGGSSGGGGGAAVWGSITGTLSNQADLQAALDTKLSTISGQPHSSLNQLDYASSGHTGFEKSLTFSTGLTRTGDTITTNDSQIVHNNLSGLQGGVAGQYNHLTNAELGKIHDPVTVSDTTSVDLTLTGQQISAVVLPAGVDHDLLLNFIANEHIDHSGVNINAGGILSGGGDITTSRTITLNHSDVDHNQTTNTHNLTTDIDHNTITNTHNLTTDIDHNSLTNTHNLTTDIDHDQLTNYVSNEHIDHSAVQIATAAATSGLTGGGDITATRNLSVDINGTTAETVNDDADKILIWDNTASTLKSQTRANFLSGISATPAGSNGEVQFNNSGAFGADNNLFWDNTSKFLKVNEVRFPTNKKAIFGDNLTGEIFSIQTSDDLYIRNKAVDKDMILQANIGGLNSEFIRLDGSAATVNFFTDKFYIDNTGKAIFGTGLDGEIFVDSNDDFYFKNITQDKDIIFQTNDGGITITNLQIFGASNLVKLNRFLQI
jgi:hypothetical protein